jgi:hypothetical protein
MGQQQDSLSPGAKNLLSQTKQFALHDSFMRVFLNNDFYVA